MTHWPTAWIHTAPDPPRGPWRTWHGDMARGLHKHTMQCTQRREAQPGYRHCSRCSATMNFSCIENTGLGYIVARRVKRGVTSTWLQRGAQEAWCARCHPSVCVLRTGCRRFRIILC